MNNTRVGNKLVKLQQAVLDDLLVLSGEALRQEIIEAGEDPDRLANQMRESVHTALASQRRKRLQAAREKISLRATPHNASTIRPAIDRIKEVVLVVFERDPALRIAFREGKRQSEADWQSLYDDLIAIGAIEPNDSDD